MEKVLIKSQRKIKSVSIKFHRYLFTKINTSNRLISLLGARGVGKTTILLQLAKQSNKKVLYVALDDLFFTSNTLYELAEKFEQVGGQLLLLDEVHKYPNWSREIKLIYDDFDNLNVIFTSSSILDIYKGESDLSRRALSYKLKEMSFREFMLLNNGIELPQYSLSEILKNHTSIALEISLKIKPLKYFKEYLKVGAYPYFNDDVEDYYQRVLNTINLTLDIDIQAIEGVDYSNIAKIKRLLYVLATNVPYTPNISKLAEKLSLPRNTLIYALQILEKAELIHTLYKKNKSISVLSKPDKIWLHNTTLNYTISDNNIDLGNIRETFFIQHFSHLHILSLPEKGDFYVDDKYTFEVGGKSKTQKQIQGIENAYIVKDDIESGVMNTIPLWLFGLLY